MANIKEKENLIRHFSQEDIINLDWQPCIRTTLTRARILTQSDFLDRGGVIQTFEGPSTFQVGDYLAIGIAGEEYPISKETMDSSKEAVTEADESGYINFRSKQIVYSFKVDQFFSVDRNGKRLYGNPGDYLLYRQTSSGDKKMWIVEKTLFTATYDLKR